MRADAFLAGAEKLPLVGLGEILGNRGVVVMAPHPDDESLGCGGLIAQAVQQGLPVRVVVLSDGVGSHPNSISHPADRLRTVREAETLAAMSLLGLDRNAVSFLRLPDREVPSCGRSAEAAADRVAELVRDSGAGTLSVTWRHDPHGDHQAAHAIAMLALPRLAGVRLLSFPIWGWALPPDHDVGDLAPRGVRFEVGQHVAAKRAAILAHRSQTSRLIEDDPAGFSMEPAMIERFATQPEIYLDEA